MLSVLFVSIKLNFCLYIKTEMEEKQKKEQHKAKVSPTDHSEFPNRRRNMFLAGLFALSAMAAYAWTSGLIQIQISDIDPAPSPGNSSSNKKGQIAVDSQS